MTSIAGYIINEDILREDAFTVSVQGLDKLTKEHVLIKIMKKTFNLSEQLERFKYEYELTKLLQGKGTLTVRKLEPYENRLAMVLAHYDGVLLKDLLAEKQVDVDAFLTIALGITSALEEVHAHHIIHKGINPSNILWDDVHKKAKIMNFGSASLLDREMPEIRDTSSIQDNMLHYMSPEQTGRMNRGIDYRTDIYSLGIIFYQLVTGQLPFQSEDMNELVHFHIAKKPVPPIQLNPNIPKHVSDIIMKLLAKMAEDRYQSLFGLKEDLKKAMVLLEHPEEGTFIIGESDLRAHFHITEKLYGREKALDQLLHAFHEASQGSAQLVLVTGYAGIGKSSLVHELYKPLIEKHGYFIAGKFDQFKRNIPYSSLAQAFEAFIQQILTHGDKEISFWRERLQSGLGSNAQIMVDLIPELVSIIGEQPPVPIIGPSETQNRFNLVFQNFVRILAREEHPLAIFLDDLQWADLPSLKLLEYLLLSPESRYFLIVGSYRDNEVDVVHILNSVFTVLNDKHVSFDTISLNALALPNILELLIDTFHQDEEAMAPLAKICLEKTQGNPFFLHQFLQTIYEDKLIAFDFDKGQWVFDIEGIKNKAITTNVVELIVAKLQELPASTKEVIQLASCLGNRFSLQKLALIYGKSPKETAQALWHALDKGLILPMDTAYKYVSDTSKTEIIYQFSHDRMQQATYSLIKEYEVNALRLNIGRVLLENTPKDKLQDGVIEIVNQYNFGVGLIRQPQEKTMLAELNLLATRKAKNSVAYKVALNYANQGIALLEGNCWSKQYQLTVDLFTERVEIAYLATEFAEMEAAYKMLVEHGKHLLDKIKAYEIKILYFTIHHEYDKAINIMLSVLDDIHIHLPRKPKKLHVIKYLIKTKLALMGTKVQELEDKPTMDNPKWQAALRIIRTTAGACYLSNPNLFVVSGFEAIILLLKHGNIPQAARTYVVYGHILCGALHEIETGYEFGQISLKLCDKFKAESIMAQVWMVHGVFIKHWHDPIDESIRLVYDAFQKGLETGDIEYAGYSIAAYAAMCFCTGKELNGLLKEAKRYTNTIISINQKTALNWINVCHQAIVNLCVPTENPTLLKSDIFDEDKVMPELFEKKDNIGGLVTCLMKIMLCFLFKDVKQGYAWCLKGKVFTAAIGVFLLPPYYLYYTLTCIACCKNESERMKATYLKQVRANQKLFKLWAKHAPMNYEHMYCIIEAELARLLGNNNKAELLYDKTIELTKQYGFIHEEALANELAAVYYLEQENERIAKAYINEAYQCYARWGARTKLIQLEKQYSHLISVAATAHVGQELAKSLDLASVMKASATIMQEIEFDSLLKKMMHILIENAGAEVGYLLLKKQDTWFIEAESSIDKEEVSVLRSIPIHGKLPLSIIQSVIRSKKPLVLDDAAHDTQFSFDPYIKSNQPKSMSCIPLLNQDVLTGLVYLENNVTKNAFTQDRVLLLNTLSSQIVVAIDNARQYSYKKHLTESYERFVPNEYIKCLNKSSIVDVALGDQVQRDMTVMACDIRNFTTISEMMEPEACMRFLNDYLGIVEPEILKQHGFIDKYIGDGLIALFSSADNALKAGINILAALEMYNQECVGMNKPTVHIGIGLCSGDVTIGTVGVSRRMQHTVISNALSIADKVEELTKRYHFPLMITEQTYQRLKNPTHYAIRPLDKVQFFEQQTAIGLYEVFSNESEIQVGLKNQSIVQFETGVDLYQQKKFKEASRLFHKVLDLNHTDTAANYFLKECEASLKKTKSA